MKIKISNFGPIHSYEFDMSKSLRLIYGKNKIGKSYAIYLVYLLIKALKNLSLTSIYEIISEKLLNDSINEMIKKMEDNRHEKVDVSDKFENIIVPILESLFLKNFQNSLQNSFSSLLNLKNQFTNKNFTIHISLDSKLEFSICQGKDGLLFIKRPYYMKKMYFIRKDTKTTKFNIYINDKRYKSTKTKEEFIDYIRFLVLSQVRNIRQMVDQKVKDYYFLPASRSGLYQALNSFTPILAELTQSRFFIVNKKIELPSLPEPLSDYFIDLTTVNTKNINNHLSNLIKNFEKEILGGTVDFDTESKKIYFKPEGLEIVLELSEASSMVSELSPILIFLKHILNFKFTSRNTPRNLVFIPSYPSTKNEAYSILFIEEPEAHLHPEIQVKLMEIFATLTQYRIKIIMTSHSNYMFNKLNNIILGKILDASQVAADNLITTNNGSEVDSRVETSEQGIKDFNYVDVAEKLYKERMSLYDNFNK